MLRPCQVNQGEGTVIDAEDHLIAASTFEDCRQVMRSEFVIGSEFCPCLANQRRRELWIWSKPWLGRLQTSVHADEVNVPGDARWHHAARRSVRCLLWQRG